MAFLIAGLGNPGPEYEHTRHNIGFDILDSLASESNSVFKDKRYGWVAELRIKNKKGYLLKPSTFMNLSGKAYRYWLQQLKVPIASSLVVTDDLALPCGKIRIKKSGSDGGHNGLKNINELMGTQAYPRLRFGIGATFEKGQQVGYVLGHWSAEEQTILKERIPLAMEAVKAFVLMGPEHAMNKFNGQ